MSILDPDTIVADFVLQVSLVFRPKTSNRLGSLHLWKKGGLFGNADELLKFCPSNGCKGFFSDSFSLADSDIEEIGEDNIEDISKWPVKYQQMHENWYTSLVLCDKCNNLAIREELPDTYGFNMTSDKIAERMAEFFVALGGAADVYLVRTKEDQVFQKARAMLYSTSHKFDTYKRTLERGRDRDCVFYSLKSIISDTTSGSDLTRRFKALLEA